MDSSMGKVSQPPPERAHAKAVRTQRLGQETSADSVRRPSSIRTMLPPLNPPRKQNGGEAWIARSGDYYFYGDSQSPREQNGPVHLTGGRLRFPPVGDSAR